MHLTRRQFLGSLSATTAALVCPNLVSAQEMKLARIIVGVPGGAPGDLLARSIAQQLRPHYATSCIVENIPGASTQIAISTAVKSAADGTTLLLTPSSPLSVFRYTYPTLPYNADSDLTPVTLAGYMNHAFAVGPMVPSAVRTLRDYLDWAVKNPDLASYGTSGSGTIPHLLTVLLARNAKIKLTNVPYRGSTLAVQDLLGGQISAAAGPIGQYLPHSKSGRLRVLAVSGHERSKLLPSVATFKEQGFPITAREWLGLFLPPRTSPEIVQRANHFLQAALAIPEIGEKAAALGIETQSSSPEALSSLLKTDAKEWHSIIKEIDFTATS